MISDCRASGWLIRALAAASILSVAITCAIERSDAQQAPDPREAMVTALAASEPHSSLGGEARVFDRFVGTWDCDYTIYIDDGSIRHSSGELMFGWILEWSCRAGHLDHIAKGWSEGAGYWHVGALFRHQIQDVAGDICEPGLWSFHYGAGRGGGRPDHSPRYRR